MKLLLDTHIWLWSLIEPARLGARTTALLEDVEHEKWLSPVSLWETLVLADHGRLALQPDAEGWIRNQLAARTFHEAPLNIEIALASRRLAVASNDPVDRFLAATAAVYDLAFVTADDRLRRIRGVTVLGND